MDKSTIKEQIILWTETAILEYCETHKIPAKNTKEAVLGPRFGFGLMGEADAEPISGCVKATLDDLFKDGKIPNTWEFNVSATETESKNTDKLPVHAVTVRHNKV